MIKTSSKDDERKNRKMVFGFLALFAAVVVIVGVGYAYFSDVITGNGTATAGTLDISGTPTLSQNGTAVAGTTVSNLNPGDVITVDPGTITNNGTKSAWIREVLQFTAISSTNNVADGVAANSMVGNLADWLYVCPAGSVQATLIANGPGTCVKADTTTLFGSKTTYAAPADVISGSVEADGAATTWAGAPFVIYFDAQAPNAAQNGNVAFSYMIQALQYRNNTTSPTETQWSTVVIAPFALH